MLLAFSFHFDFVACICFALTIPGCVLVGWCFFGFGFVISRLRLCLYACVLFVCLIFCWFVVYIVCFVVITGILFWFAWCVYGLIADVLV